MLKYYEVKNFLSYKSLTGFNLEKTNYQTLSDRNVKNNILKGLLFVGSNASGKSNSIYPVRLLLDLLFGKNEIDIIFYHCIFSLDPGVHLRYVFEIDGKEIEYIIIYQSDTRTVSEKLSVDSSVVLERNNSYARVSFTEQKEYTDIPQKSIFLRELYFNTKFRGNNLLQKWFMFLSNSVYIDFFKKEFVSYKNENFYLKDYLDANGTSEINAFFKDYNFNQQIEYHETSKNPLINTIDFEKMVLFKRDMLNVPVPLYMESLGNVSLLHFLPYLFHCIKNNSMLILDEFSSGFHNDLEELMVKYFMEKSDCSQLLFVSHSTNLLSNRLLRPDQIYSVEFNNEGSHIFRFSNEKPREAQNLEKMYLSGVFGGVPNYED